MSKRRLPRLPVSVTGRQISGDGVDQTRGVPRRTPEEVIAALRSVAAGIEGPLSSRTYARVRTRAHPTPGTAAARFGSWAAALDAAGLPPTGYRRHRRWTEHEAVEAIATWL